MSAKTDGVKFQLNVKNSAGTLLNFYFYEVDEKQIISALETIANCTPEIQAVEILFNAHGLLKEALGATPVEQKKGKVSTEGGDTVKDKWDNEWTYNLPNAPDLPDGRGKYAFKKGVGQNGKTYRGWFDPAKGPKPFKPGATEAPTIWPS